jgi:hypothetical protein
MYPTCQNSSGYAQTTIIIEKDEIEEALNDALGG